MKINDFVIRQKALMRLLRFDYESRVFDGFFFDDNRLFRKDTLDRLDVCVGYEVELLMENHNECACKVK